MSNSFEIAISINIKMSAPREVIETIRYLVRKKDYILDKVPDHDMFREDIYSQEDSWRNVLQAIKIGISEEFPGCFGAKILRSYPNRNSGLRGYAFSFRAFSIDYMFDKYIRLLRWLANYVDGDGFVGYYKWTDSSPYFLYLLDGKVYESASQEEFMELSPS